MKEKDIKGVNAILEGGRIQRIIVNKICKKRTLVLVIAVQILGTQKSTQRIDFFSPSSHRVVHNIGKCISYHYTTLVIGYPPCSSRGSYGILFV